jgi:antitoxin component YwqK of YwqJK toxin-antitoxin module
MTHLAPQRFGIVQREETMSTNHDYSEFNDSGSGVYPDAEFHGIYEEYWPNGKLKYRGEFEALRKRVGQHVAYWENGFVKEISYWLDGWVCGTVSRFYENGVRDEELHYGERGSRTRAWVGYSFGCRTGAGAQIQCTGLAHFR